MGLRKGTDVQGTIDSISQNVRMRGVNLWMLVCSAILASIGLDMNSTPVIIGAMLISPLMTPILGVGIGIAIFDLKLLRRASTSLALAAGLGLLTSTTYFAVSPLGELTAELSSRTTPTLLDVGVAFFGGIAGIVATSRRDSTTAIPGVAIATALMPPLCTAGFGLANASSSIFLGAFYLFFLNAVIIAIATYLMAVLLQFPRRTAVDGGTDANVKRLVIGFAILTVIPSGLIFYNVLEKLRVERNVKAFVNTECLRDDRQPLKWELVEDTDPQTLKVYLVGSDIAPEEQRSLQARLADYGLGYLSFKPIQLNVPPEDFKRLSTVESNLTEDVRLLKAVAEQRSATIGELQSRLDALAAVADPKQRLLTELPARIKEVVSAEWQTDDASGAPVLAVTFRDETPPRLRALLIKRIAFQVRNVTGEEAASVIEKAAPAPLPEN